MQDTLELIEIPKRSLRYFSRISSCRNVNSSFELDLFQVKKISSLHLQHMHRILGELFDNQSKLVSK